MLLSSRGINMQILYIRSVHCLSFFQIACCVNINAVFIHRSLFWFVCSVTVLLLLHFASAFDFRILLGTKIKKRMLVSHSLPPAFISMASFTRIFRACLFLIFWHSDRLNFYETERWIDSWNEINRRKNCSSPNGNTFRKRYLHWVELLQGSHSVVVPLRWD